MADPFWYSQHQAMGTGELTQQPQLALNDMFGLDGVSRGDLPSSDVRPTQMSAIDELLTVGTKYNGHIDSTHGSATILKDEGAGSVFGWDDGFDDHAVFGEDFEHIFGAHDNSMPGAVAATEPAAACTAAKPQSELQFVDWPYIVHGQCLQRTAARHVRCCICSYTSSNTSSRHTASGRHRLFEASTATSFQEHSSQAAGLLQQRHQPAQLRVIPEPPARTINAQ